MIDWLFRKVTTTAYDQLFGVRVAYNPKRSALVRVYFSANNQPVFDVGLSTSEFFRLVEQLEREADAIEDVEAGFYGTR